MQWVHNQKLLGKNVLRVPSVNDVHVGMEFSVKWLRNTLFVGGA